MRRSASQAGRAPAPPGGTGEGDSLDAEGGRRAVPCAHADIGDAAPHDWAAHLERVIALRHSDPARCVDEGRLAIEAARVHGEIRPEMEMSYYVGFALHMLGRPGEAYAANDMTLKLARSLRDAAWEGRALNGLGTVFSVVGEYATAIRHYEQSLALHRACADRRGEASALNNLGEVYRAMGGFEHRAVELYQQARDLFHDLGLPSSIMLTNIALAQVALSDRLLDSEPDAAGHAARAACATAAQAVGEADASGERRMAVGARLVLAQAEMALGLGDEAKGNVLAARRLLTEYADVQLEIDYRLCLARLLRTQREDAAAIRVLAEALALCEEHINQPDRLKVLRDLELAQEAVGDLRGALATVRELHRASLRLRDEEAERRAHVVQAQMDVERARHEAEVERIRSHRLEQQNLTLARLAREDELTGLPNRRAIQALLQAHLEPWGGRPFVFAFADLDHFKRVNDRFSHQTGDEVLRRVGTLMRESLRGDDLAARFGGEEFAIFLPGTDADAAGEVCERLRRAVERYAWRDVQDGLSPTISIGATAAAPGDSITSLLARADALLYRAKTNGRNRVEMG